MPITYPRATAEAIESLKMALFSPTRNCPWRYEQIWNRIMS
jgi:hypothetical protein